MDLEEYSDDLTSIVIFPEGKIVRITFDASVRKLRVICKHYEMLNDLQEAFSAANPSAFFVSRYGYKTEAKVYAVNKFGYFDPGLLFEILRWIVQEHGGLEHVVLSDRCKKYVADYLTPLKSCLAKGFQLYNVADDLGRNNELVRNGKSPFEFRDYQQASVECLLKKGHGRGLIEIPTAGGKSFILANFIWNICKNVDSHYRHLILVPNKQLVEQFYKDLLDYGFSKKQVTRFSAGKKAKGEEFDPEAMVIITNRQYVFSNKEKLPKVDVLICDEAHTCLASASHDFIERLNCRIKIGCSGTLPRDKYQRWQLVGLFSDVVYKEDITALQARGFISKLKITLLKVIDDKIANNRSCIFNTRSFVKYRPDEFGHSEIEFDEAYKAEHLYFEKNYRDLYRPIFEYVRSLKTNTLVLFDRIEIGQNLFDYAKELYAEHADQIFYIDGSVPVDKREEIRAGFEKCEGNLLFAQSAVFSTGINVKRLTNLIFLTSSKSFSRTIQSIGRTLRLHESKTEAHLIDCSWSYKYSEKHLEQRLAIYKSMYGKGADETLTFHI